MLKRFEDLYKEFKGHRTVELNAVLNM